MDNRQHYSIAERVAAKTGIPADLIWSQWAHETNGFTSRLAQESYNFGGLTQEAPNDSPQPDGGNYYMSFGSPEEYADYYSDYIQHYSVSGVSSVEEFATALREGGYYTAPTEEYVSGMNRHLKGGSDSLGLTYTGPYGTRPPIVPTVDPQPHGFWTEAKDWGAEILLSGGASNTARYAYTLLRNSGGVPIEQLTQDDVDYVVKEFPGDTETQKFVLSNARTPQHLSALVAMKTEDRQRETRLASYKNGLAKAVGVTAGFVGAVATDPLSYVPLGQNVVLLKALGRLGPTASRLALNKFARYAELGATGAGVAVADQYAAEVFGGERQDYTTAALLGGLAGAGIGVLGDFLRSGKVNHKVTSALDGVETHAIAAASDAPVPSAVPKDTKAFAKSLHNAADFTGSPTLSAFVEADKVFLIAKKDIPKLANRLLENIPENAKAFHKADEGYTILIKDNLAASDNLDNILAHEIAVHKGLKGNLGETAYNAILEAVRKRIVNPQGPWKDAVKATPGGGPEEVLGYFIEKNGLNNKIGAKLKGNLNKSLRSLGLTQDLTDGEIVSFVKRSMDIELEKAQGYRMLPDGSAVVFDQDGNGLLFSAENLFNPNILADFGISTRGEVLKEAQGDLLGVLRGFGETMEAGYIYGTPAGILGNSVSRTGRKLGATFFHDARMREYKGSLVTSIEKMKEDIQGKLLESWSNYLNVREEALYGDNLFKKAATLPSRLMDSWRTMEFDRQVFECFNARYAGNTAGLKSLQWSPEVEKAAAAIKQYRELQTDIAKRSSEMFSSKTPNLLPKNAEPFDQELWRVVDEDKMLNEVNRFPSFEAFQEHLENYWKKAVKGDVMEKKLLHQKTQEWEALQAKWEREYVPAKKRLDEWESKVEAIEAKDKQRHTKAVSAWERQVETNKVKDAERHDKLLQQWDADLQAWQEKTLNWPKGKPKPPKPLKPKAPPATPKAAKPQLVSSPRPPKPTMSKEPGVKPPSVSPEELQAYINEEARKTAYGMTDRDASNLDSSPSGEKGALPFMRERFPADTSTIVETPWGEGWSFDTHLRSYDMDRIVLKNTNRFSGEVAIRNAYETPEELERVTRAYKSELDHALQNRAITEAQHAKELRVWEDGLNRIKGVRNQGDVKGLKDALSRLLRTEAYNTSGSMMVTSQYGEVGGAIAYTGMKALFHLVPGLADYMKNLRHGQGFAEAVRAAEKRAFGETMSSYIWQNRTNLVSRAFKEATTAGSKIQKLDALGTAANFMSRIVSSLPPVSLAKLTDTMVSGARYDTIADSIEWAFGREKFGITLPGWTPKKGFHLLQSRNPFSEPKLKAAGVSKDFTGKLKQDIQTYTEHNPNGTVKSLKVDLWERERPNTYHKWKMLIDNQAMRAIQQPTIGNQNVLKDQNWFTHIMFQFKDFTFKAVNGQAMRALTHHEIEDATNALLSLASNGMVYAGLTVGRAWAYFPNDKQKRDEYLDSRLTLGNLAWAGMMRGAILGSAPSLAMDVYEASTGRQSFRTTTDRTSRFTGREQQDRDFSDMVGDALTQFPAVKAATAPYDILRTAYKAADPEEQVTKRDLRTLMQTLPLQNWLPMVYLVSQMIDETDLPEKDVFKRR